MRYSREELSMKSIAFLRGIDIKDKEEEDLVQEILDKKLANMPPENPIIIPSTATDDMTPEKEKALQAKLDAKRGKSVPASKVETPSTPEEPVDNSTAADQIPQTTDSVDVEVSAEASAPKKAKSVKK